MLPIHSPLVFCFSLSDPYEVWRSLIPEHTDPVWFLSLKHVDLVRFLSLSLNRDAHVFSQHVRECSGCVYPIGLLTFHHIMQKALKLFLTLGHELSVCFGLACFGFRCSHTPICLIKFWNVDPFLQSLLKSGGINPGFKVWVVPDVCKAVQGHMIGAVDSQFMADGALLALPLLPHILGVVHRVYVDCLGARCIPGLFIHRLLFGLLSLGHAGCNTTSQLGTWLGICSNLSYLFPSDPHVS